MHISPARWKAFVLAFGACVTLLYLWALSAWPTYSNPGTLGVRFGERTAHQESPIAQLAPGSPLAAAGAKVGDRIRLDHNRDARRYVGTGEVIGLQVLSGDASVHRDVVAAPGPPGFFTTGFGAFLTAFVSALALAIGMTIGLRRADHASVRFFALAILMQPLNYANLRIPPGAVADFLDLLNPLVPFSAIYFSFVCFCLTFPDSRMGPWRSRLRRLLPLAAVAALAIGSWGIGYVLGWIDAPVTRAFPIYAIACIVLSLAGLILAWREATGDMRTRIAWITFSMGLVYLSYLWGNAMALLGLTEWAKSQQYLSASAIAAGYFGLAYALLRHRIFDIGFAVNRALVYAAVSATILLAFGLLEWLSHKLVHFDDQQHNVLLDAGIALVVFLAFNKIHHFAEQWVERLFFHAWHEREAALRKFVKQASHFAAPATLIEALRAALARFTGGATCAIYARDAGGAYRLLSGDAPTREPFAADAAIAVTLRTDPVPTVLDEDSGANGAALALPMASRGSLNGFILLGPKPVGESYRPDEIDVLGFVARQVGYDLHALEVERLRHELDRSALEIATANAKAEAFRPMLVNGGAHAE